MSIAVAEGEEEEEEEEYAERPLDRIKALLAVK
jgi:hypothetical protein